MARDPYAVVDKLGADERGDKLEGDRLQMVNGLTFDDYSAFVEEIRQQPGYRASMDIAADYYDGNQLSAELLAFQERMGLGSLMTNLIKPTIDTVLGVEAKNRTDFRMTADDDQHQDVAEALSIKLAEAERESRADRACSDAYAAQVKTGLGWVHVTRNPDPFGYKYKTEAIHRREMFWDWASKDPNLDDARYVHRQKWFPTDQVIASIPSARNVIAAAGGGWQPDWMQRAMEDVSLQNAITQENRMSSMSWEWRNLDARRVALQECWYGTFVRGLILRLPSSDGSGDERIVEFDKNNPLHMQAVQMRIVKPEPAVYRKLRCSLWLGPHRLQDYDPGRNKLPYVPFWGFREDLTGVPYGLVRAMIPLQDEINARRRKLMWLLSSKRVMIDSDALDQSFQKLSELADEVARPDALIVLNPARTNKQGAIQIETDLALASQQFEIMQEAKEGIQAVAGIFNSLMGKTDGAKSGIAVNALVEQSSNTLGEINDNFKMGRQAVGERLVELIRQDMSGRQVDVVVGAGSAKRRTISLNKPTVDDLTGVKYFENDSDKTNCKVALEEVPSTPAYRAQALMQISETLKSLPPELQAPLMPFYLEASDLPQRKDMADALRKVLGQLDEAGNPQDPQVAALKQQLQALQQQSDDMAGKYEQAVQEQTQKVQELTAKTQQQGVMLANKDGELQIRARELDFQEQEAQAKRDADAAAAEQSRAATDATKQQTVIDAAKASKDVEFKDRELALKERDQGLKESTLEHQQLAAASEAAQPTEPEGPSPEEAVQAVVSEVMAALEKVIAPLADKVDMLMSSMDQQAKDGAAKDKKAAEESKAKEKQSKPAPAPAINVNVGVPAPKKD